MTKSNIQITSNIFIRNNSNVLNDTNFLSKITGILSLNQLSRDIQINSLSKAQLTDWQEKLLNNTIQCSYYKPNNSATHGIVLINDKFVWSCRCEAVTCRKYKACTSDEFSKVINRADKVAIDPITKNTPINNVKYTYLTDPTIKIKQLKYR
jgi:hypothetical protein